MKLRSSVHTYHCWVGWPRAKSGWLIPCLWCWSIFASMWRLPPPQGQCCILFWELYWCFFHWPFFCPSLLLFRYVRVIFSWEKQAIVKLCFITIYGHWPVTERCDQEGGVHVLLFLSGFIVAWWLVGIYMSEWSKYGVTKYWYYRDLDYQADKSDKTWF